MLAGLLDDHDGESLMLDDSHMGTGREGDFNLDLAMAMDIVEDARVLEDVNLRVEEGDGEVMGIGEGQVLGGNGRQGSMGKLTAAGAGLLGALCMIGVVVNSGIGSAGSGTSRELVPSNAQFYEHGHSQAAVRRVLSLLDKGGDLEDIIIGEGEGGEEGNSNRDRYNSSSEGSESSWVFHPVEAFPSKWREVTWRTGKAPWVWQRALDLFSEPAPPSESLFHNFNDPSPSSAVGDTSSLLGGDRQGRAGKELTRAFSMGYMARALGYHDHLDHSGG
ncbi:unnamed protein product, partial [Choristocarpus tenellus]